MDKDEIERVNNSMSSLEKLDVAELMAVTWPEQELSSVSLDPFTAAEFLEFYKRMLSQLKAEIEDSGLLLPMNYQDPEFGNQTIEHYLKQLHGYVSQKNWQAAVNPLRFLIRYQIGSGFWNRSKVRVHAGNDKKAIKVLSDLELKVAETKKSLEILSAEKDTLIKLITSKQSELDEIENLLNSARHDRQEIEKINTDAAAKQATLNSILENQQGHLSEIEGRLSSIKENEIYIDEKIAWIDDFQKRTKKYQEEIESKRNEIYELTGKAADGSLGGTFQSRFEELERSVVRWLKYGIPLASVCGVTWLTYSLLFIEIPTDNLWLSAVYLSGKLAPTIIIIAFALKQYSRERNFLEEYAFKSAVAFTVNAYADQLANERFGLSEDDFGDNQKAEWTKYVMERENARKSLIQGTVEKLYRAPRVYTEKSSMLSFFRPKSAKDILQEARDLIRETKNF